MDDGTTEERGARGGEVGRTAARGTAKHLVAQAVSMASGYVVVVVLARGLGPEAYGVYGIVMSVLLATELIGRLGIPQATSKLIAEGGLAPRELERTSLTLTLVVYLVITAAFVACAPLLARFFDLADGARLFRIAALDIPFYGMLFATQHVLNGERRFGAESLGVALYGVSKALGVLALLWIGISVERALVVNAVASAVGLGYFALRLAPGAFRPALGQARPLLALALPTSLLVVAAQLLANLDLWCLKWIADPEGETVGHYVAATNIARLPSVVHFVLTAVMIPSVARAAATEGMESVLRVVRQAFRFLFLFLLPACAWLALRSEELMRLVYDEAYVEGAAYQAPLVFRFGFLATCTMTVSSVLLALGRPGLAVRAMLAAVAAGALVLVPCIHAWGAQGAALGAVVALALGAAITAVPLWRAVGPFVEASNLPLGLAAVTAVWGTTSAVAIRPAWLPLDGLACLAVVAALLFLLGGWTRDDVRGFLGPGRRGG